MIRWYLMPVNFLDPSGGQEWTQIVEIQIVTDVAVEVAIGRVAGITFLCAPDLFARFAVPSESGRTGSREAGGEDGVSRSWIPKHQAVRIE